MQVCEKGYVLIVFAGESQGKSIKGVRKKPVPFTAGIAVRHKACVRASIASRATRSASHSEGRREGSERVERVEL